MFFYQLGYIYKNKIEGKIKTNTIVYFLLLVMIQIALIKIDGELSYEIVFARFKCKYIVTPIISSITGIMFWLKISEILEPSLSNSKIVNYISNNTNEIMQHHLFWIFMVNLTIFKLSNVLDLSEFNSENFKNTIYYFYTFGVSQARIIYTIIAIMMPLLLKYFYDLIKEQTINIAIKK